MNTENAYVSWDLNTDITIETQWNEETEDLEEIELEDTYVLIMHVYVPLEQRGKGIARRLLTEALEEIRVAHPGLPVRLACEEQDEHTDGERLAAFYESMGFVATGRHCEMELS